LQNRDLDDLRLTTTITRKPATLRGGPFLFGRVLTGRKRDVSSQACSRSGETGQRKRILAVIIFSFVAGLFQHRLAVARGGQQFVERALLPQTPQEWIF
jgi:hypothetical protein